MGTEMCAERTKVAWDFWRNEKLGDGMNKGSSSFQEVCLFSVEGCC